MSSERVQTRCHTHRRTRTHLAQKHTSHQTGNTRTAHASACTCVHTRARRMPHLRTHLIHNAHACRRTLSHAHITRRHTPHMHARAPGLSEASLLVHSSGMFRLKVDQTGKALCGCNPWAKGGRAPDFRDSERPQAAGPGQEAERASHTEQDKTVRKNSFISSLRRSYKRCQVLKM